MEQNHSRSDVEDYLKTEIEQMVTDKDWNMSM